MRSKFTYGGILVVFLVIVCACHTNDNKNDNKVSLDFKYKKGENLNPRDWECYVINNLRVCIPTTWIQISNQKTLFFSNVGLKDSNTFFVVLKHSKENMDVVSYLKETNIQLTSDTNEIFKGYTAKVLNFESKITYYCEYFTKKSNVEYITYSSIFEDDNSIYEVALKTKNLNTTHIQEVYKNILFNIKFNEESYFSPDDPLLRIDDLDLSKL